MTKETELVALMAAQIFAAELTRRPKTEYEISPEERSALRDKAVYDADQIMADALEAGWEL